MLHALARGKAAAAHFSLAQKCIENAPSSTPQPDKHPQAAQLMHPPVISWEATSQQENTSPGAAIPPTNLVLVTSHRPVSSAKRQRALGKGWEGLGLFFAIQGPGDPCMRCHPPQGCAARVTRAETPLPCPDVYVSLQGIHEVERHRCAAVGRRRRDRQGEAGGDGDTERAENNQSC